MGHTYVKENETFNTSRNGVVPKPTQADVEADNVLKADGTWGEGGGTGDVADVYVNGESVLDEEDKIAKITSYKEVTQSEYNALPESKNSDNVLYCIKDAPSSPEGFPPLIYSYEEREIGVWADGKPLYQKTINVGAIPAGTSNYLVDTGITNASKIINIITMLRSDNNYFKLSFPLPSSIESYGIYQQGFNKTNGKIRFDTGANRSVDDGFIIIQYTKTTDVAGSGTWITQGALAHHYSTTEHIIGTWIDGKPIYEKTVSGLSIMVTSPDTWIHSGIFIPYLGDIISIIAGDGQNYSACGGRYNGGTVNAELALALSSTVSNTRTVTYVILQYTKTTD